MCEGQAFLGASHLCRRGCGNDCGVSVGGNRIIVPRRHCLVIGKIAKAVLMEWRGYILGLSVAVLLTTFIFESDVSLSWWLPFAGSWLLVVAIFETIAVVRQERRSRQKNA